MATVIRTTRPKKLKSSVTGHYVLMPATKQGSVSLARARKAVKAAQEAKK